MVDVSYQIVLSTLQTVGLLVGIFYYIMTIRINQRNQEISIKNQELTLESQRQALETRQAQLFMQLTTMTRTKEWLELMEHLNFKWSTFDEWSERIDNDVKAQHAWINLSYFYEQLGVLVREGYIDIRLVALYDTVGITAGWEYYREIISVFKKDYRRSGENWEYVYDELMKYLEEHPELKP